MGFFSGLLDLLFPPKCVFCRRVLPYGTHGSCQKCKDSLPRMGSPRRGNYYLKCIAPLRYEGNVREAVIRFKFHDQSGYATEFARIMAESIREELEGQYDLISWIPVSQKRRKERGYDQAMLLALAVALELQDVAVETLGKEKDNPAQSSLTGPEERMKNVKNAYVVTEPELVYGKRILLIDDILTTGATMDEAAKTLLKSGAQAVVGAALAQPPYIRNNT